MADEFFVSESIIKTEMSRIQRNFGLKTGKIYAFFFYNTKYQNQDKKKDFSKK